MEQLGCKYITRALVQINGRTVKAYSHFGMKQACKNAVWKYRKLYGAGGAGDDAGLGVQ